MLKFPFLLRLVKENQALRDQNLKLESKLLNIVISSNPNSKSSSKRKSILQNSVIIDESAMNKDDVLVTSIDDLNDMQQQFNDELNESRQISVSNHKFDADILAG